jgi:hypothetical protein
MRLLRNLSFALAVLLPLALLCDLQADFYYDWHNHQWYVGYFGEYFRQHFRMPAVLNGAPAVGMLQPVFYGYVLYPCLGVLASIMGASAAIRVGALLAVACEFCAVYAAAQRTLKQRSMSWVVAASVIWSVYSLTNLYNRAALPEFFATSFLATAVAFGAAAGTEEVVTRRGLFAWLAGTFGILALGTHPPTALVGGGFALLLLAVAFVAPGARWARFRPIGVIVLVALLGAVVLAPWVYANWRMHDQLGILTHGGRGLSLSPGRCDSLLGRFAPFPFDALSNTNGTVNVSTPYVEAPVNFALLVFAVWNLVLLCRTGSGAPVPRRTAWWFAGAGLGWFAFTVMLSLSRPVADAFRFLGPYVQAGTRLVSHANLGLLVAVFATGAVVAARGGFARFRPETNVVAGVGLAIALLNVGIKLTHAAVIMERPSAVQYTWAGDRAALVTAGRADAVADYAAIKMWPPLSPSASKTARPAVFSVGERGSDFGIVRGLRLDLPEQSWVTTNAVAFPWSRVTVDGSEVPAERLAVDGWRLAVNVPPGEHELKWEWRPDPLWSWLHTASQSALLVVLGVALGWALAEAWRGVRGGPAAEHS